MALTALLLLAVGVAAQHSRVNHLAFGDDFTINRLHAHRRVLPPSELRITDNIVSLKRKPAASLSSIYLQSIRDRMGGASRITTGNTTLIAVQGGNVFLANMTVGGQIYSVVVDTGSSDPWLAANTFECHDPTTDQRIANAQCGFGSLYNPLRSSTYQNVSTQNFNISYADGEYLTGDIGYEKMTMGGITVVRQQFGVVDSAAWYGDGYSSGLVGFAYSTLTSAYAGADPLKDVPGQTIRYNPLFVNMYQQNNVPPVFSLAISRDTTQGGVLALGGIPNVPHSYPFYNATILPIGINASSGALVYEYYSMRVGGFGYSNNGETRFNTQAGGNPNLPNVVGNNTITIVDSGTSIIYLGPDIAAGYAAKFTPPGTFDAALGLWTVDCAARVPYFAVAISNKLFPISTKDMKQRISATQCVSAIQSNNGGFSILGDTFFKSMLVVFDVGAGQMNFAQRL